jgi:hypothetical protein
MAIIEAPPTAFMLKGALQRNAKHEARLSNISGYRLAGDERPEIVRDSSPAAAGSE